jgi:hypothetical protein
LEKLEKTEEEIRKWDTEREREREREREKIKKN